MPYTVDVSQELEDIKLTPYGKKMRPALHSSIEKLSKKQNQMAATFDSLIIDAGQSNAEVVAARVDAEAKQHASLKDRLDADAQEVINAREDAKTPSETHNNLKERLDSDYDYLNSEIEKINMQLSSVGINILFPPAPLLPCVKADDLQNPNFNNRTRLQAIMDVGVPVYIPNGEFIVDGYVSTSNCLKIYGEGTLKTSYNGSILVVASPKVTVEGITLSGDLDKSKTGQTGIFVDNAKYFLNFNNVKFLNFGGYGLHIKRCQQETNTATVSGCEFVNNNTGVFLDERGEFVNITGNCKFRGNEISLLIAGGNNSVIGNNINSTGTGIKLIGGMNNSHGIISNNNIDHCYDYGIYIDGITEGETISNNHIYASAIYIKDSTTRSVRFIDNVIDSNMQGEGNDKIELINNKFVCSPSMSRALNFGLNAKPSVVVGYGNTFDHINYDKFVNKIEGSYLKTGNNANVNIQTRKVGATNVYTIYNLDGTRSILTNLTYQPLLYIKETGIFNASGLSINGKASIHSDFVVLVPTAYESELPATFKILDNNNIYYTYSIVKSVLNASYIKYTYTLDTVIGLEPSGSFKIICTDDGGTNFLPNATLQRDESIFVAHNL